MIKVGCSGFPVGRKKYEAKLAMVEASQFFDRFPLSRTIEKWKEQAPKGFEFIVCAPKVITHLTNSHSSARSSRSHMNGYFQDSHAVKHAYNLAYRAARTLSAKIIFFNLPPSLQPQSENIGRIQKFFGSIPRDQVSFVWEPPGHWPLSVVEGVSKSLHISPAVNPLKTKVLPASHIRYFRLGSPEKTRGIHSFSTAELQAVKKACDRPISYVIFNNGPTAFDDAVRFNQVSS